MRRSVFTVVSVILVAFASGATTRLSKQEGDPMAGLSATSQKVQKLISEQKYQAALDALSKQFEHLKPSLSAAKVVTQAAQLQVALSDFEDSIKTIETELPRFKESLEAQVLLRMIHAHAIAEYVEQHQWEISQRRFLQKTRKSLRELTIEELFAKALKSLLSVWNKRSEMARLKRSALQAEVEPNTYPAELRGTLRHTYTSIVVNFLNVSLSWMPEQLLNSSTLSVAQLLKETGKILDSEAHPLKRIASALNDLAQWDASEGRSAGALLAKLQLLEILHERCPQEMREDVRGEVHKLWQASQKNPWSTLVAGRLGEMSQLANEPSELVRAHKVLKSSIEAFPKHVGARLCQDVLDRIEFPYIQISTMRTDGSEEESLGVDYKNVETLFLKSYSVDFDQRVSSQLKLGRSLSALPDWSETKTLVASAPQHTWSVSLPKTSDFLVHKKLLKLPAHKPGLYLITASLRSDLKSKDNIISSSFILISPLVLQMRTGSQFDLEVKLGQSGNPSPAVEIKAYQHSFSAPAKLVASGVTDPEGRFKFQNPQYNKGSAWRGASGYLIVAKSPEGFSYLEYPHYPSPHTEGVQEQAVVFTDRAIYRPGQKILWKVLFFKKSEEAGRFIPLTLTKRIVTLKDANGEVVSSTNVETDSFGTAWGEFTIPKGRLLGNWQLYGGFSPRSIRVEEYKRPTFEVVWDRESTNLVLGKKAEIKGTIQTFSGGPVDGARIKYVIQTRPVFPWWCQLFAWDWGPLGRPRIIESGEILSDQQGRFTLNFLAESEARIKPEFRAEVSQEYTVQITTTDKGGETQSSSEVLTASAREFSMDVSARSFFLEGSQAKAEVSMRARQGGLVAAPVDWTLHRLIEPERVELPGNMMRPKNPLLVADSVTNPDFDDDRMSRWSFNYDWKWVVRDWKPGPTIAGGKFTTEQDRPTILDLKDLKAGSYRLKLKSKSAKFDAEEQVEFFVANSTYVPKLPFLLLTQKAQLQVGEELLVWAPIGFKDQIARIDFFQDSQIWRSENLVGGKSGSLIRVPISPNLQGGISLQLKFLRNYQALEALTSIWVPWSKRQIEIDVSRIRNRTEPGREEEWTVTLRSPNQETLKKGAAQLLAYMYDRSLDSIQGNHHPSLLSLFPHRILNPNYVSNLGLGAQVFLEQNFPRTNRFVPFEDDRVNTLAKYGIGGPGKGQFGGVRVASAPFQEAQEKFPMSKALQTRSEESAASAPSAVSVPIRADFSETAFFFPALEPDPNGNVSFKFKVPDSLTSWMLWLHAIGLNPEGLHLGSESKQIESSKDLMVRVRAPRFFRAGDKVNLSFTTETQIPKEVSATLQIELLDGSLSRSVVSDFGLKESQIAAVPLSVRKGSAFHHSIRLKVPHHLEGGAVQVRATVRAKGSSLADGEVREVPVLSSRIQLAQSRFSILPPGKVRELSFSEKKRAANPDQAASQVVNESLKLQVDGQLLDSVLAATPYLLKLDLPCNDLLVQQFVTTGILVGLYRDYPSLARLGEVHSKRSTKLEALPTVPSLALEESPWLLEARGGPEEMGELVNVLKEESLHSEHSKAFKLLKESQLPDGGFSWVKGAPSSPLITTQVLYGLSQALEFGVEVPMDVVRRAWLYLDAHRLSQEVQDCLKADDCWEWTTFLSYVLSNYPDRSWTEEVFDEAQRKKLLDYSFKHWKLYSPYLKAFLALALKRFGRIEDARLVWDSVMDSAITSEEEGTHWARHSQSWIWYNDTIETHAMALRALVELGSDKKSQAGLVRWLMLNKKLNHWGSTRSTAEVIYSLASYHRKHKGLDQALAPQKVRVAFGAASKSSREEVFELTPGSFETRRYQKVLQGESAGAKQLPVRLENLSSQSVFASLHWSYSTSRIPKEGRGDFLQIRRSYFLVKPKTRLGTKQQQLVPLSAKTRLRVGDEIEVQLTIKSRHLVSYVQVRDPRPSTFEPVHNLSAFTCEGAAPCRYEEVRDSGLNLFFEQIPQGEFTVSHRIRASTAGEFQAAPATLQPLYAQDFAAYSSGETLRVED